MSKRSTNSRMRFALLAACTVGAGTTWSCSSTSFSGFAIRNTSGRAWSNCTVTSTSTMTTSPGTTTSCSEWFERIFSIAFMPMAYSFRAEERCQPGDVADGSEVARSRVELVRLLGAEDPLGHVHELGLELGFGERVAGVALRIEDLVGELAPVRRPHGDAPRHAVRDRSVELVVLVHDGARDHRLDHRIGDGLVGELVDAGAPAHRGNRQRERQTRLGADHRRDALLREERLDPLPRGVDLLDV